MLDLNIPEISATAGALSDGVVRGSVTQSQLLAAKVAALQAATIYALQRDADGGEAFVDVSALAAGTVADALLPWGTNTSFSAADEFWLAAEKDICSVYVDLTTPGAWTGTGLSVLESVDGETLTPVGNLVDGSNGMRNVAGVYKISFDLNLANRRAISPIFGGAKRKYVVLRPNGLTAKTVSPKLRRVWMACDGSQVSHINVLPTLSGVMTSNDFSAVPASQNIVLPVVGDTVYFGLPGLSLGLDDAVYRRTLNRSGVYEYLATDNTWKALQGVSDPGNQLKNGPSPTAATPNLYSLRWTVPSDWGASPLILAPAEAQTAYWMRFRVTDVSPLGPVQISLYRRRSRSFGAGLATGIYHKTEVTYTYVTYDIGVPSTTAVAVSFTDAANGVTRSITIPANARSGYAEFTSGLTIGATHQLLISHVSGGSIQDCELRLM